MHPVHGTSVWSRKASQWTSILSHVACIDLIIPTFALSVMHCSTRKGMRTRSRHDDALGKQVHAALQHLSTLGAQLVQPGCQPACADRVLVRA